MSKKKPPKISLQGLDDMSFNSEPDLDAAQKIIEPRKSIIEKSEPPSPKVKEEDLVETPPKTRKPKKASKVVPKGTLPPINKKRTSFNIDENLYRAIKDHCYFAEIDMVDYIFGMVKADLKKKGKYPPRLRK